MEVVEKANAMLENEADDETIQQAFKDFEAAIQLDNFNIDAYLGKVYVMGLMEQFEEAEQLLQKTLEMSPEDERIEEMLQELQKMKVSSTQEEKPIDDSNNGKQEISTVQNQIESPNNDNTNNSNNSAIKSEEKEQNKSPNSAKPDLPAAHLNYLVDKNGVMTPYFYEVLAEIFERFDADKDKSWNLQELERFFLAVNGVKPTKQEISFIRQNCQTNNKGNLTMQGFMELELAQTSGSPEETWNDLQKLGYDKKLNKIIN